MSEWLEAMVGPCGTCGGSGVQGPVFGEQCEPCYGTGLDGVEWHNHAGYPCRFFPLGDTQHKHPDGCRLVLVISLERSQTHV